MLILFYFIIFLCWGSFLNMLAYRLIHGNLTKPRSFCPTCKNNIAWYDNIPLISWIVLRGKCRTCSKPISILYPSLELLSAIIFLALITTINPTYMLAYGLFFSALIVTIRTDLETMLISRFATIFLIPLGLLFSYLQILPISLIDSCLGILLGAGFLWIVATIFKWITKKDGMGQGDIELLAFIGSFLGPIGCWISLLIGSVLGSVIGIAVMLIHKKSTSYKIPFGPFLACGAILFVLAQEQILSFLFHF